jgi:peptidoglycan/xylan/chitin deacetylase (PgdA/CDA1 family)
VVPPRRRRPAVLSCAAFLLVSVLSALLPGTAAAQPAQTVVSITFDDGNADQLPAAQTLQAAGLKGTFYIPSGFVDSPDYLTRADLTAMAGMGHEIGGHSVTHPDLPTLPADEGKRQICDDRVNLTSWGFRVTSFAYPFASATAETETLAAQCGYNSARGLGDIQSRFGCADCPFSESMTPEDKFYLKALDQVDNTWTLADLQTAVTNAETRGGGWVQITFHHIGGSDPLAVPVQTFDDFVAWLAPRAATNNTVVKTVDEVIGGAVQPLVNGPVVSPPGPGVNGVAQNASLETDSSNPNIPACYMLGGYGENTPTFTTTTTAANAHEGTRAENVSVANYVSGDAKLLPTFDLGGCSPSVTAGRTYSLRAWYKSDTVTQFAVYTRSGVGTWSYWTSSPYFAVSPTFTQAVWTTPAIPAGVTGLSFGLNQFNNGLLTTDSYSFYDTEGAPDPAASAPAQRSAADDSSTGETAGGDGALAAVVSAPPEASTPVTETGEAFARNVPTGDAAHRDRDERRGPAPGTVLLVPGPNQVEPGTPIVPVEGVLTG